MRKTKKKQNQKQNLMTHPTLEEKTKIKESDIADNPQIQTHSTQETRKENHETPEKRNCREEVEKTINLLTKIPEIPLREVTLRNSCHGLSPLDTKPLDTNVNNNENNQC